MKTKIFGALLAAVLFAGPAIAQDKPADKFAFTATLGGVSDYRFRGISQTDNEPAVQGSLEAAITISDYVTGYINVWGSNVKFVPLVPTDQEANAEFDYTVGFRGTIGSFGYDLKYILYTYPGSTRGLNYDYSEYAAAVNYDFGFVIPTVGINWSTGFFGNTGSATYVYGGVKVPIPFTDFSPRVVANIGRQKVEDNTTFGVPDYTDWNVGLFATFFGALDVGVQWVDTNIKDSRCFPQGGGRNLGDLCSGALVGSVGYTLTF